MPDSKEQEKWKIFWTCFFHKRIRSKDEKRKDSKENSKILGILLLVFVGIYFVLDFSKGYLDKIFPDWLNAFWTLIVLFIFLIVGLYFFLTKGRYCYKRACFAIKILSHED